ncbi:uncharacterized protein LACBIDRAFT_317539 [Laccaria bicolor S238N-H82]|uniref:Predicted protein n=1 Tax=Laccaria bicolor (strain S238N-H82 / ATCC MYA-4686) TaxID=486041 RepID=B0E1X5_LACBS|nr:uncharacterized protein LACBIDRAFT_317539 [Laccaria bicolor S238N-H82]EDQ99176.1 predicted protein [Laccaria bicolor S238N-H82]|eukprot:XP_001890193.1 predicted protein [Laccaria bicolor S238N-H82]
MREGRKGERPNARRPPITPRVNVCFGLFLFTLRTCSRGFPCSVALFLRSEVLRGSSAGRVQVPIYLLRRVLVLAVKLVRTSIGSIKILVYSPDTHVFLPPRQTDRHNPSP